MLFIFKALYYEGVGLSQIHSSPKRHNVLEQQPEKAMPPCSPRKTSQKRGIKLLQVVCHKKGRKDPYQTEDDPSGARSLICWVSRLRVPSGLNIKPTAGVRRMNPIFSSFPVGTKPHLSNPAKLFLSHESYRGFQEQHLTQS